MRRKPTITDSELSCLPIPLVIMRAERSKEVEVTTEHGAYAYVPRPVDASGWERLLNNGWTHARINGLTMNLEDLING